MNSNTDYNGASVKANYTNNITNLIDLTSRKAVELANANSVIGEPIKYNGYTVIPVSKISAGFAGGGVDIKDESKRKCSVPAGSGSKVTVTPLSFLVISENDVNVINIDQPDNSFCKADILNAVIQQVKSLKKNKDKINKAK